MGCGDYMTDSSPEDVGFPSGADLLTALIDLHRKTSDEDMIELIETEIKTTGFGLVSIANPGEKPAPEASVETLLDLHDTYSHHKHIGRYLRLRIFEKLNAFDQQGDTHSESDDDRISGLTDGELRYLSTLDDPAISMLINPEMERRGIAPRN